MVKVQRGNVVLQIEDYNVDKYMGMGYNVIDDKGNIINECIPTDLGSLQKHFVESKKKIAELENQIAQLQKKEKASNKKKEAE